MTGNEMHNAGPTARPTSGWPALSMAEAEAALTAPGAPFEMELVDIRGVPTRTWKHAPATVAALLVQSRRHGERTFSVLDDERVSYESSFRASAVIARWLTEQGVRKGDRVALAMRNLPEWPAIFFGIIACGAIAVPLNAWWTGHELAYGLQDSGASVLFCDPERHERIAPHRGEMAQLTGIVVARAGGDLAAAAVALEDILGHPGDYGTLSPLGLPEVALDPEDDATIFYTSGTTGGPKGALGTHRNLLTCVISTAYTAARSVLRRGDPLPPSSPRVRLITVPLFHVTGCNASMMSGVPAGNTNIYMRRWDPLEAMKIIERERVNLTGGVPTIVWQLLDHPERSRHDLSSLESVAYGGAPGGTELVRRVFKDLGAMPGNGWGMTETTSTVAGLGGEDYVNRPDSCGPPVPVAELKVTDPGGAPLPSGRVGELWAKGPMVVKGYWNHPDATATAFVDGWVRTGDLARLDDDGFCTIVDRLKDVIIRGGENIYCAEVEDVLQAHPGVLDAALVGLPHATLGEQPAAVIQRAPGAQLSEADIQAWVRSRLAAFKAPAVVAVIDHPLPRNAGGKVLKTDLRALFIHLAV